MHVNIFSSSDFTDWFLGGRGLGELGQAQVGKQPQSLAPAARARVDYEKTKSGIGRAKSLLCNNYAQIMHKFEIIIS
jgi:hypothetical protein